MKVSIVTVSYNSAATIGDTINSVFQQTYPDIEYWIIDGNSTDGTVDVILQNIDKFHGRLHYISEPDKGLYDAMNKGIHSCTGDIIGTLNSDDYFTANDVIERVVATFDHTHVDAVYGDIHFIKANDPHKITRYYSSKMFHPFWIRFGFMPAHPSLYVRREIYKIVGDYSLDYKIASDFDMNIRLFHILGVKYAYVKMDFVTMRSGGVSNKNINNRLIINKEQALACKKHGIYTNSVLISFKYFLKIFELKMK